MKKDPLEQRNSTSILSFGQRHSIIKPIFYQLKAYILPTSINNWIQPKLALTKIFSVELNCNTSELFGVKLNSSPSSESSVGQFQFLCTR